jgi:hypothetical protein
MFMLVVRHTITSFSIEPSGVFGINHLETTKIQVLIQGRTNPRHEIAAARSELLQRHQHAGSGRRRKIRSGKCRTSSECSSSCQNQPSIT